MDRVSNRLEQIGHPQRCIDLGEQGRRLSTSEPLDLTRHVGLIRVACFQSQQWQVSVEALRLPGQSQHTLKAEDTVEGLGSVPDRGAEAPLELTAAEATHAAELVHTTARVLRQPGDARRDEGVSQPSPREMGGQRRLHDRELLGRRPLLGNL